ncbi:MAG: phage portal protein [Parvularcula sp.]|jgi:HK97 family phage portal protein|nr:phage portal protein [Parvularcula sp.]
MLKRRHRHTRPEERKTASLAELIALHGAGEPRPDVAPPSFTSNVVAYRCVRMIAEAAASVPLIVKEDGTVMDQHPAARLLCKPNPDETGTELLEEVYGYLQTHGNAYLEKIEAEGCARALFLLPPHEVEEDERGYRHRTSSGTRLFRSDAHGRLPLLHLSLWQPRGGKRGHAPMRTASEAIHLHNAAAAWNRQLLDNAARPSGALIHKGSEGSHHLTPEQFDRLRAELDAGFSGLRNAGRPLLLDGGLDWRPMGLTPAEMDFQNLKNSAARDIALAFGVPPMLLGIPGDNTYANYAQANLAFWRLTVLPLVRRVSEALAEWIDISGRLQIEMDLSRVEALGPERSAALDRIASAEFLTDAEKRVALGFPPEPREGA